METARNKTIQLRVNEEEKAEIEASANAAGMKVSDFIRTITLSSEKIIMLSEGSEIANLLTEVHKDLRQACRKNNISDKYAAIMLQSFEEICEQFNHISEKLTDIRPCDEDTEEESE